VINKYRVFRTIFESKIKGTGRVVKYLKKIWLPPMRAGMVITTLYGFKMKIDPINDPGIERVLYGSGAYEEGTLYILGKILKPGQCFVDAGANIGLMSLYVAHKFKDTCKIYAYEPHPETTTILYENIKINGFKNITVMPFALGESIGETYIFDRKDINRGGSSLVAPPTPGKKYPVSLTTLDTTIKQPQVISVLKIDVEGYELQVLKGAEKILKSENPPMLIIEYSAMTGATGQNKDALYRFIMEMGRYRIFKLNNGKAAVGKLVEIFDEKDLPEHDNIFCCTEKHRIELKRKLFE
jgi:FkbM family methyltransferase